MYAFPALLPVGSLLVIRNPNTPTEEATRLSWVFLKIRVLCGESRVMRPLSFGTVEVLRIKN